MLKAFRSILLAVCALVFASCATLPPPADEVLIFSHTTGYRHDSIAAARPALAEIVTRTGALPVLSEDPAVFDRPERFRAIILLSATTRPDDASSEWLAGARRDALQTFVRRGRGIVAIHAAADSHYHWPWYARMIGGQFVRHPEGTPAGRLTVTAPGSLTAMFGRQVTRTDEWYVVRGDRPADSVLMTLDPASIGEQGRPWPMSWAREFEGGRVFTTVQGHRPENYAEPAFLAHLEAGLRWAMRR